MPRKTKPRPKPPPRKVIPSATPGVETLFREALALHQSGRSDEAEIRYRQILAAAPNHPDSNHLLGVITHQKGDFEEAEGLIRKAISANRSAAVFHNSLGNTLNCLGRHKEAEESFRKALALDSNLAQAHFNLGYSLAVERRFEEATDSLRRAVEILPSYSDAFYELGNVHSLSGRLAEAVECYVRAIQLHPGRIEAYNNLGLVLGWQGSHADAEAVFRQLLLLDPKSVKGHSNLAGALMSQNRFEEALASLEAALRLDPECAEAHNDRGAVLEAIGDLVESTSSFRRAVECRPTFVEAHSNLLFGLNYREDLSAREIHEEHLAWGERHAAPLGPERPFLDLARDPNRKLRVAYLSPDFRTHSVAYFIEPILAAHNPDAFEVIGYSDVPTPDKVTRRIASICREWRPVFGKTDSEVAEMLRHDRIDIAVDLAGHTGRNRLLVFARKPAPVQVSYLGYPNTSGVRAIDYRITDFWTDPEGEADTLHSERLVRLESGFNCYLPPPDAPPVTEPPLLSSKRTTFGSFNNLAKVNRMVISAWAGILRRVPDSRLLIKTRHMADPLIRNRVVERFGAEGIAEERLVLVSHIAEMSGHLDAYRLVDIALDPFPFNGATTTCEALWMGVPVIALAGDRHAGRVGAGILARIGLPDLVAEDLPDYINIAETLAADRERLRDLRLGMRDRLKGSTLLDAQSVTRALEAAYRRMWIEFLASSQ